VAYLSRIRVEKQTSDVRASEQGIMAAAMLVAGSVLPGPQGVKRLSLTVPGHRSAAGTVVLVCARGSMQRHEQSATSRTWGTPESEWPAKDL